jgi:hypothetical protein
MFAKMVLAATMLFAGTALTTAAEFKVGDMIKIPSRGLWMGCRTLVGLRQVVGLISDDNAGELERVIHSSKDCEQIENDSTVTVAQVNGGDTCVRLPGRNGCYWAALPAK